MESVFITGSTGYIGSAIATMLAGMGIAVTAGARQAQLQAGQVLPSCRMVEFDVIAPPAALPGRWDVLIHTATANDVVSRDFRNGVELSVHGTRAVLEFAKQAQIPKVLFFSTLQVYGTELVGEITATTPPRIESAYALNHLCGEHVCELYARDLSVTVLRPANVYGCPVSRSANRSALVPSCFVLQALQHGQITLLSSGLQRRDFVSLAQVAGASVKAAQLTERSFSIHNIASGVTLSIREAAEVVAQVFEVRTGRSLPILIKGSEPGASNDFVVHSEITPEIRGGPKAEMAREINQLFDYFEGKPQDAGE